MEDTLGGMKKFRENWAVTRARIESSLMVVTKQRTMAVKVELLAFIESARQRLADELFRQGGRARWDEASLGRSVDRILIRLLFLRMCADRGVRLSAREYRLLEKALGLSLFDDERERAYLADRVLAACADGLAREWPDSAVVPAEALSSVYESFLKERVILARSGPRFEAARDRRKHSGAFYTPQYIVDYIVEETVGKVVAGKSAAEISAMRFLDPACGAGRFLLRVYERILEEHTLRFEKQERREGVARNGDGKGRLSFAARRKILEDCVFGVDIDEDAIPVAKLSLMLKLLEAGDAPKPDVLAKELSKFAGNIKCGNSLVAREVDAPAGTKGFAWEEEFPQVFRAGGYDVVLGNPPYGAQLSEAMRKYLSHRFDVGTSDTSAVMMVHAQRSLTKSGGVTGFIVPKAFTYSSNWEKVRHELIGRTTMLADAGKVWPNVKLEQVIYVARKVTTTGSYANRRREGERFCDVARVAKSDCRRFGFLLNGITPAELKLGLKIREAGAFLGEYVTNTRGAMLQDRVSSRPGREAIGGKQIQRFRIEAAKGFIPTKAKLEENVLVRAGSILVQNIVAHIENPLDHIKITAAVASEEIARRIAILDTVNQLTNTSNLSSHFFLAILNSQLMNWYVYRFIYARAIRTMHFDRPVTSRIPIPRITVQNKAIYEQIVDAARTLSSGPSRDALAAIERGLHVLYGLNEQDVAILESGMPAIHARSATACRP
jgi:Eco57I restriction-modification methylase